MPRRLNLSYGFIVNVASLVLGLLVSTGMSSPGDVHYVLTDEVGPGIEIGDVLQDSGLKQKYSRDVLRQLRFRYLNAPSADFIIEERTGILKTGSIIDRDVLCPRKNLCEVKLDIAVQPVQYFQIIKVSVEILDINDNSPTFPEPHVTHQILESASSGASFLLPNAIDDDSPQFGIRGYDIESNTRKFDLQVTEKVDGSTDVRLILKEKLDREIEDEYRMTVIAYDGGEPSLSGSIDITIQVLDANDHDPKFEQKVYEVTIPEDIEIDTSILKVHAVDPDAGRNGRIVYSFSERTRNTYGETFGIDGHSGDIFVRGEIDYETTSVYHLAVVAEDKGPDSLPDDSTVLVRVRDINDHAPVITVNTLSADTSSPQDVASIAEAAPLGTFVAHITVVDKDKGINGEVDCSLNSQDFTLEKLYDTEYKIVTAKDLDREQKDQYTMELLCQDRGEEQNVEVAKIQVQVKDINDHEPVFENAVYRTKLLENNFAGAYLTQVNASDKDIGDNARIEFRVEPKAANMFSVDPKSGYLTASTSFDREVHDVISFHVLAVDHGEPAKTGSALVHVDIEDINDQAPAFKEPTYSFKIPENKPTGSVVGQVEAEDGDAAPNNKFSYTIIDTGIIHFEIDGNTGEISTLTILDREEKSEYMLKVTATDKGIPPLTSTVSVRILVTDTNDLKPQFDFPTPYNNTVFISNKVPIGYTIATIHAHDLDELINADVEYYINNNADIFEVEQVTGHTKLVADLSYVDHELFEVNVIARDLGDPPLQSLSTLFVVVNGSIPFTNDENFLTSGNLSQGIVHLIVIIVAVSAFLITICLITAIVCLRYKARNKDSYGKYNCRTEAMKMLQREESEPIDKQTKQMKQVGLEQDLKDYGSFTVENEHTESPAVKRSMSDRGLHLTHLSNGNRKHHDAKKELDCDSAYSEEGSISGRNSREEKTGHDNYATLPLVDTKTASYSYRKPAAFSTFS